MLDLAPSGLRRMAPHEAAMFAGWERSERPYPWTEKQFLEEEASRAVAVLEGLGGPHAFAVLQVIGDEGYLLNIMVAPALRRRGLGEALLQKVMIWAGAAGAARLLLDVDPANAPAVRLYQKTGFEVVERRPRSYPRGEDALLMRKSL